MEALPIFLDRMADPLTAVILSVTVVLIFGAVLMLSSFIQHRHLLISHLIITVL